MTAFEEAKQDLLDWIEDQIETNKDFSYAEGVAAYETLRDYVKLLKEPA